MTINKTIEQRLNELEERLMKLENIVVSPGASNPMGSRKKKLSVKEFLMTKEAKTEIKKVLILGYYLEHIEGMESFNATDIEAVFRSAKEKPPKKERMGLFDKILNKGKSFFDDDVNV